MDHPATALRFYLLWGRYPGVTPIGSTPGYVPTTPTAFNPIPNDDHQRTHEPLGANVRIVLRERSHQHTRTFALPHTNARINLCERSDWGTCALTLTYANIRIVLTSGRTGRTFLPFDT